MLHMFGHFTLQSKINSQGMQSKINSQGMQSKINPQGMYRRYIDLNKNNVRFNSIQFNSIQFYLYSAITKQGALQSPEPGPP